MPLVELNLKGTGYSVSINTGKMKAVTLSVEGSISVTPQGTGWCASMRDMLLLQTSIASYVIPDTVKKKIHGA